MSSSQNIVRTEIEEVGFSLYTDEEVRNLSVCKITSPIATDALGNVVQGGLEDSKLGLVDSRSGPCVTCGMNYFNCPGHMGHIDLCVPVRTIPSTFIFIFTLTRPLYCIALYCIVLYRIVLYCIVLHSIVLYCILLHCIALYCIVL